MSIYLGGSRALAPTPIVGQVVRAIIASGQIIHVGCSLGADRQVIQAAIGQPSSLVVFAAFGWSVVSPGSFSSLSNLGGVKAAEQAGAVVHLWAGGNLSVPMRARLIGRSRAALAGCAASVFFSPGPGSLAVASFAVAAGQPVFAFYPVIPQSPRGCLGSWQPAQFLGFPGWQWQPVAVQQSLI